MNESGSFAGVERRQHAVFVTRNTEYHVRRGTVIAVRSRDKPGWLPAHLALQMHVDGHFDSTGAPASAGPPVAGQRLYLVGERESMITSRVHAVERPSKETVAEYPADEVQPEQRPRTAQE
jgi:hypothetical protein